MIGNPDDQIGAGLDDGQRRLEIVCDHIDEILKHFGDFTFLLKQDRMFFGLFLYGDVPQHKDDLIVQKGISLHLIPARIRNALHLILEDGLLTVLAYRPDLGSDAFRKAVVIPRWRVFVCRQFAPCVLGIGLAIGDQALIIHAQDGIRQRQIHRCQFTVELQQFFFCFFLKDFQRF